MLLLLWYMRLFTKETHISAWLAFCRFRLHALLQHNCLYQVVGSSIALLCLILCASCESSRLNIHNFGNCVSRFGSHCHNGKLCYLVFCVSAHVIVTSRRQLSFHYKKSSFTVLNWTDGPVTDTEKKGLHPCWVRPSQVSRISFLTEFDWVKRNFGRL